MKIYVAGPSHNITYCREVIAYVEAAGHEITWDWTKGFEAHAGIVSLPTPEAAQMRRHVATKDIEGVKAADALLMLYDTHTVGMWIEFGVACATETPVVCLIRSIKQVEALHRIVFPAYPPIRFTAARTISEAMEILTEVNASLAPS
jgi:nucleoside 2-deoxyribosyltransferase